MSADLQQRKIQERPSVPRLLMPESQSRRCIIIRAGDGLSELSDAGRFARIGVF